MSIHPSNINRRYDIQNHQEQNYKIINPINYSYNGINLNNNGNQNNNNLQYYNVNKQNNKNYSNEDYNLQNQLKHSLKEMYLNNINMNAIQKKLEKENRLKEEKEEIMKFSNNKRSEDLRDYQEKIKNKNMLFNEYINYNNLNDYYSNLNTEPNLNDNSRVNNSNTDKYDSYYNKNKLNFMSLKNKSILEVKNSIKPLRNNERNLSNKIGHDYYSDDKPLFTENNNSEYLNFLNKYEYKHRFGKKVKNFNTMGDYDRISLYNSNNRDSNSPYKAILEKNKLDKVCARDIYLGDSELKHNPITNPMSYVDSNRYKNYIKYISSNDK